MISADEKRFWLHNLAREVIHHYDLAYADCANDNDLSRMDTSRVAAYERAFAKLVGCCIPFQYYPEYNMKAGIIRIRTNTANRLVMTITRKDGAIDVDC